MTDYETIHAGCVDSHTVPPGPGDVLFQLRIPIALIGPAADHLVLLETGTLLTVDANVACIRETALNHCCGVVRTSALRLGIAGILGLLVAQSPRPKCSSEPRIDDWITEHTLVSWRAHATPDHALESRLGWLDTASEAVRLFQGET